MKVFRPTYPWPIPEGTGVHTTKGRKYVNIKDHNGRTVKAFLTKDGKHVLRPQRNYAGRYRDLNGVIRTIGLLPDKEASQAALNELANCINLLRANRAIPPLSEVSPVIREKVREALAASGQETAGDQLSRKPLKDLFVLYLEHLRAAGTTEKHRREVERCLNVIKSECGFQYLRDICQPPVKEFINRKKDAGLSDRTVNCYVDKIRYFCKWAMKNGLTNQDPFVGFVRLDEQTNRVREARSLTPEEVEKLLDAAAKRPLARCEATRYGKIKPATIRKLTVLGEGRRLAYALMLYTGLRVNETRQLVWADVDLKERLIRVRPTTTKNSKSATLPLHSYLVELLSQWKQKHPGAEPSHTIVNIPASTSAFLKVFDKDLEFAGIAKTDDLGRVVHLHALRHSFASLLARQGVHPHVLRSLARHSRVETTMQHYTHVLRGDDVAAIESLSQPNSKKKSHDKAAG